MGSEALVLKAHGAGSPESATNMTNRTLAKGALQSTHPVSRRAAR